VLIRKRSSGKALQVGAFQAVALPAEQLEVVNGGRTAESHRDEVVVLKVEFAAALDALATVAFEDCPADFPGDRLTLRLRPWLAAFVDVEQHVSPVQALGGPALTVPDQRQDILLRIAAGLPVEGVFEPPPDAGPDRATGTGCWLWTARKCP